MKKFRITSIPQNKKLNTFAEGGEPCPDGYRKNYLGTDCVPMEAPEQTNDEEWYRNWYANRMLQDEEGQQLLETARPKILKRAEKFPEEEWYTKFGSSESGSFEPLTGKITLNRGRLDSNPFLRNEVKFHEKGHYLTSPSMLDPETDTAKEVDAHPIQQLKNYEADVVNQALKERKDIPRKDRKYYDYLTGKGEAKRYVEEISKNLMQARRLAGFKPGQVVTDDDINNFYKQADEKGWTNPDSELFVEPLRNLKDFTKGPEELKMLFNKLAENKAQQEDEFQFQTARYGGSLDTYAGGGEYRCADDEKWDDRLQKCVKIVQNLSESTIYDPEGKKIQTNLFQKLKDAKDAYQNFTKKHKGKKWRLNEADSASSIEQLRRGIQLYKDEFAKEQESTRAELKKLDNLKNKAALKNNKDIQNLSLKDLNTVKGKMKIEDAIRNSDLDSGTIAALYKGFNLNTVDRNVMKEGYKGQWQDAVNEANARKTQNYELVKNLAGELSGYNAAGRIYDDPLGTLKGVGQTVADIYSLPFGLTTGAYNYATNGNFDMGKNIIGQNYGEGLDEVGDVASVLPFGSMLGTAGKALKLTKAGDLVTDFGKGFKTIGTKLDQKIYPTRAYRSEGFAVDPERFSTTDNATKQLAEKVGKKGDWATKDLEEAYQYLRGLGFDESQGLLSGKNVKFTEYKLPFWKKDVSADPDVIALKKLQGTKINSNEYIVPGNTALDRFLYPRRTNIIKGIPEHVKSQKIYPSQFPEGIQTYYKGTIPMNVESETLSSPAYKYVEDQLNAVTGHEMPITHEWNSNYFPIKDWQQPQFAPNEGVGKFTRFSSSLPGSSNASISDRLKQFFDRPPGPMMLLGPSGGSNMVKKNISYYEQLLKTYDSKVMSATNKKFYKDLIATANKQNGMVTEAQLRELDRLKTGNFDFGKRGFNKESLVQVEPKAPTQNIIGSTPEERLNEMYREFNLPETKNKEAQEVFSNFKQRIESPEGKKRLKQLGIKSDDLLQKIKLVEDEFSYGYYSSNNNMIALNPGDPLMKQTVRHEIEHAIQNAIEQDYGSSFSDIFKNLFKHGTFITDQAKGISEIDNMLSKLDLRKTPTPNKQWTKNVIGDEPVDINNIKTLLKRTQNATDYFATGSGGKEKSAFLGEVQQYMMDKNIIPKNSYVEITPKMVEETFIEAVGDDANGGAYLRLFNIMKPTEKNYEIIAKALNKMLVAVPTAGAIGTATMLANPFQGSDGLQQQKKGGVTDGYIEMDIPKSKVQWYIDNGYDVEVLE